MEKKKPFLPHETFNTGIKDIDEQHLLLFNTIEIFNYENNSKETLWNILLDEERYTSIHFETEEKYMEKFNYPFAKEHAEEHKTFVAKFSELKNEFAETGFTEEFITNFRKFLTTWLSKHYNDSDIKLADFLNERLKAIAKEDE